MNNFKAISQLLFVLTCSSAICLFAGSNSQSIGVPVQPDQTDSTELESSYPYEINNEESSEEFADFERAVEDLYAPIDYSTCVINTIGYQGSTLTMADGSIWIVRPSDAWIAESWNDMFRTNDPFTVSPSRVYITSNNNWVLSTNYPFIMVNMSTNESIYCYLSQAASPGYGVWIQHIDYYSGRVELAHANGFQVFYLSYLDSGIYRNWVPGQRVIYGRNTKLNKNFSPYLIINIDSATNARGSL